MFVSGNVFSGRYRIRARVCCRYQSGSGLDSGVPTTSYRIRIRIESGPGLLRVRVHYTRVQDQELGFGIKTIRVFDQTITRLHVTRNEAFRFDLISDIAIKGISISGRLGTSILDTYHPVRAGGLPVITTHQTIHRYALSSQ